MGAGRFRLPKWNNWSGKLTARPSEILFVRSEADAEALVRSAAAENRRIRVAGATHSHAPLLVHDDLLVDTRGLSGIVSIDLDTNSAWIAGGSRIHTLGRQLHTAGLALQNQGDIDEQAIAGATATGTHGTGTKLGNLSSAVTGMRIATSEGLVECTPDENAELWRASRLHLGAFGLVTQLRLQLRPAYRLQEVAHGGPLEEALEGLDEQIDTNRHYEFFWSPQEDEVRAKSINETDNPPVYPLAEEGQRCAWNYEVLPNYRPHKHTEMEYSVPAESGPACMREIAHLLKTQFTDVVWPVEYRTLAADDVWLSTAYDQETVTISVHQDVRVDDEPYFRACEEIFLAHAGRPHWGKVHYLDGAALARIHPRWEDWWRVRDEADPHNIFVNDYLKDLRYAS